MKSNRTDSASSKQKRFNLRTDIPLWVLIVLASITVPRAVIHDLHSISLDSALYAVLSVAPLLIYLAIAIFRTNKRPFYDFMVLGLLYGLFLAVAHQLTWNVSWGENVPEIGGNLKGVFDPFVESLIMRFAAFTSSITTGLVIGAIFGAIAVVAQRIRAQFASKK